MKTKRERKEAADWLERLKSSCGDNLSKEQKDAIIKHSKHVVWKKVDDDFKTILP